MFFTVGYKDNSSIDRVTDTTIERWLWFDGHGVEAEIGKELTFASFETADFHYRLGMYDKLIRDILDYPHQKLLDKLNMNLKAW